MVTNKLSTVVVCLALATSAAAAPIEIGSRLELFVDDYLIGSMTSGACRVLHHPTPQEVSLRTDQPWEGNGVNYVTVFQDGEIYRMYYRGGQGVYTQNGCHAGKDVYCYAESKDGIHWVRPKLGLFECNGSKDNNIVWDGVESHNFTPFKDANPACKPEQRYKALGWDPRAGGAYPGGLMAFQSADGIRWTRLQPKPVIAKAEFDSQNVAFWDSTRQRYVAFHRNWRNNKRGIMTATSTDFLHWTDSVWLECAGACAGAVHEPNCTLLPCAVSVSRFSHPLHRPGLDEGGGGIAATGIPPPSRGQVAT